MKVTGGAPKCIHDTVLLYSPTVATMYSRSTRQLYGFPEALFWVLSLTYYRVSTKVV